MLVSGSSVTEKSYRRPENCFGIAAVCLSLGLFFAFATNDSSRGVDKPEASWAVASGIGLVLCLVLAVRALRAGVYVTQDTVVVKNVLRSHTIPISRVLGFRMSKYPLLGGDVPVALLTGGRPIRCGALAPPNPAFRPRAHRASELMIEELNTLFRTA